VYGGSISQVCCCKVGKEAASIYRAICVAALAWANRAQHFRGLMFSLAGLALLSASEGKVERAVELYALVTRYPFVAKSRWFDDMLGRPLAAAAATLPPEVVEAARARGRARDLDVCVAELVKARVD
jgi:hypothetical protein